MATDRSQAERSWAGAARDLAARVNRRARLTAAVRRMGWVLLAAGVIALLWRAFGGARADDTRIVAGLLGAGAVLGIVPAWRAARRIPPVADADAAWALDRLASARGRGLAAAAATGPAASEAAFADGGLAPPPRVRLLPPHGLLPVLAAVLLGAVALLAPARQSPEKALGLAEEHAAGGPGGAGAPGDAPTAEDQAGAAESEARALDERATAAERVRAALNLPEDGPLDPEEVAELLADPERRQAAADTAEAGTPLADLLGKDDVSGDALARLLAREEDNRALASQRRRAAAGARAARERLAVPPGRRGVVERYLQLIE